MDYSKEISLGMIEDPNFNLGEYLMNKLVEAFNSHIKEEMKKEDFDIINGEGAYERLIFGGGAGL